MGVFCLVNTLDLVSLTSGGRGCLSFVKADLEAGNCRHSMLCSGEAAQSISESLFCKMMLVNLTLK